MDAALEGIPHGAKADVSAEAVKAGELVVSPQAVKTLQEPGATAALSSGNFVHNSRMKPNTYTRRKRLDPTTAQVNVGSNSSQQALFDLTQLDDEYINPQDIFLRLDFKKDTSYVDRYSFDDVYETGGVVQGNQKLKELEAPRPTDSWSYELQGYDGAGTATGEKSLIGDGCIRSAVTVINGVRSPDNTFPAGNVADTLNVLSSCWRDMRLAHDDEWRGKLNTFFRNTNLQMPEHWVGEMPNKSGDADEFSIYLPVPDLALLAGKIVPPACNMKLDLQYQAVQITRFFERERDITTGALVNTGFTIGQNAAAKSAVGLWHNGRATVPYYSDRGDLVRISIEFQSLKMDGGVAPNELNFAYPSLNFDTINAKDGVTFVGKGASSDDFVSSKQEHSFGGAAFNVPEIIGIFERVKLFKCDLPSNINTITQNNTLWGEIARTMIDTDAKKKDVTKLEPANLMLPEYDTTHGVNVINVRPPVREHTVNTSAAVRIEHVYVGGNQIKDYVTWDRGSTSAYWNKTRQERRKRVAQKTLSEFKFNLSDGLGGERPPIGKGIGVDYANMSQVVRLQDPSNLLPSSQEQKRIDMQSLLLDCILSEQTVDFVTTFAVDILGEFPPPRDAQLSVEYRKSSCFFNTANGRLTQAELQKLTAKGVVSPATVTWDTNTHSWFTLANLNPLYTVVPTGNNVTSTNFDATAGLSERKLRIWRAKFRMIKYGSKDSPTNKGIVVTTMPAVQNVFNR